MNLYNGIRPIFSSTYIAKTCGPDCRNPYCGPCVATAAPSKIRESWGIHVLYLFHSLPKTVEAEKLVIATPCSKWLMFSKGGKITA